MVGLPTVTFAPSPLDTRRTSSNAILSPALPGSFSTTTVWPASTRYCFPPVWITAYMASVSDLAFGIADFTHGEPQVKTIHRDPSGGPPTARCAERRVCRPTSL